MLAAQSIVSIDLPPPAALWPMSFWTGSRNAAHQARVGAATEADAIFASAANSNCMVVRSLVPWKQQSAVACMPDVHTLRFMYGSPPAAVMREPCAYSPSPVPTT